MLDAGIVDEDIEAAVPSRGRLDRGNPIILAGYVEPNIKRRAAGSFDCSRGVTPALVKHFDIPTGSGQTRRLETRVLVHQPETQSAPARWLGVTYRWNANQSDASLLTDGLDEPINVDLGSGPQTQAYHYPAAWECVQCHNSSAGERSNRFVIQHTGCSIAASDASVRS